MPEQLQPENTSIRNRFINFLWIWIARIGLWSVAVLTVLMVLVQLPFVQNRVAQYVAKTLSNTIGTKVTLDYLYFAYLDRLTLRGFYVEDFQGDTLLYSGSLEADFIINPFVLFTRGLTIEELELSNAHFNIRRIPPSDKTNLELLMERLAPSSPSERASKPFQLDVKNIYLRDVSFLEDDRVDGQRFYAALARGSIEFKTFDLPNKRLEVKSVDLREPVITIDKFPAFPVSVNTAILQTDTIAADTGVTRITVDKFLLQNGTFSLHDFTDAPVRTTPPGELDFEHLDLFNLNINLSNFSVIRDTFRANIQKIALQEKSGFVLNELSAQEAVVSPRQSALYNFKFITPYTQLGDTLIFKHRSFDSYANFNDDVIMDGRIYNSAVALRDIMTFAPALKENIFFNNNRSEIVQIDGQVRGKVNNLRVRDLNLRLSDGSVLQGNFSSRNLAVKNEELINLRLERLVTRASTLRDLVPSLQSATNLDRLGRLSFRGSFDGFFQDFVAYGDLNTDIGRAVMDMRMNLKNGAAKAGYSGRLSLQNFDLGKWTSNPDFGKVTFTSEVKDGRGLNFQTASARLTANIQNFQFKQYDYKNAKLDGELNRNLFDGNFAIQDSNVNFTFSGLLNYKDTIPLFDFRTNVNKLDLKALNLSDKDLTLRGNIDLNLRGDRFSTMEGEASVKNLQLVYNKKEAYTIQFLEAMSYFNDAGNKVLQIESDALTANITGRFDIEQIPDVLLQYVQRNYPAFADRLNIKPKSKKINPADFTYTIFIKNSKGLHKIIDEKLGALVNIQLDGLYSSQKDSLLLQLDVPSLQYDNVQINDAAVNFNLVKNEGLIDIIIDSTTLNNKQSLDRITLLSRLAGDTLDFGIDYASDGILSNLLLEGLFYPVDSTLFEIKFKQSNLLILENIWIIDPDNRITFGKNYIKANNFSLQSKEKKIFLSSVNNKGLKLAIYDFNFSEIDKLWKDENLDFGGKFNVDAEVGDLFKMQNVKVNITSDSLLINECYTGSMNADVTAQNLKSQLQINLAIQDGGSALTTKGTYNLAESATNNPQEVKNYYDFNIALQRFPLCILESFVNTVFSQMDGYLDGNVRLNGTSRLPSIGGALSISDGLLAVDYTKTTYTFSKATVKVNNFLFDFGGLLLRDKYGHTATVRGGLRHNRLKDLRMDIGLRTPRFLVLDTQKGDNSMFYGQAIAEGDVRFNGPFNKIDIIINATIDDSTHVVIPLGTTSRSTQLQFVRFVDRNKPVEEAATPPSTSPSGVSLEMNLGIREEAQVELVLNEQTGDVIRGSGRGNIRILLPRGGEFQMFGDYIIEQGDYLFALYNVFNKNFTVRKGGSIQWTGDPLSAQINLEAEYRGLNTSVANFIQEYLVNATEDIKNNASQGTDVVLLMHLQGDLRKPVINFDIEFPALAGELKTYSDNKLRLLQQDQNELNRQVFGLIVVGQFLPTDFALQGSEIIYNTVSEFVSNQLSLLLTELFSDLIADGRVLSGVDLDIAYNQYQNADVGNGLTRGDEFQVQLRQNFFNNRLSVLVGGNLDIGNNVRNAAATGTFFGNDVVIEYVLNKDRSLKLRVYQRLQPDIGGGRRFQVGSGVSFRKEFNTLSDFWRSLRGETKKLKENQ